MSITLNGTTGISSTGGIAAADLTGTLPALDGAALTGVLKPASSLTAANLTGALPAISGAALTGIESGPTYATAVATTSGTAFDFTGIPTGVKVVKVLLDGVGVTGGYGTYVQLGTASGISDTGYTINSQTLSGSAASSINTFTEGIIVRGENQPTSGVITLTRRNSSGNIWIVEVSAQAIHASNATWRLGVFGGGVVDLGAELTQLRLKVERIASQTFNSGSANISWSS